MQVVTEWCTCVWLWTEAMWAGMEESGAKTGEESSRQARNGKSRFRNLILQKVLKRKYTKQKKDSKGRGGGARALDGGAAGLRGCGGCLMCGGLCLCHASAVGKT